MYPCTSCAIAAAYVYMYCFMYRLIVKCICMYICAHIYIQCTLFCKASVYICGLSTSRFVSRLYLMMSASFFVASRTVCTVTSLPHHWPQLSIDYTVIFLCLHHFVERCALPHSSGQCAFKGVHCCNSTMQVLSA